MKNLFKSFFIISLFLLSSTLLGQTQAKDSNGLKNNKVTSEQITKNAETQSRPAINNTQNHSSYSRFLYFFVGLLIGGGIIYFYSRLKIYSILSMEKSTYKDTLKPNHKSLFLYIGLVQKLKESKNEKKRIIEKLENEISELKKKTNAVEKKKDVTKLPEEEDRSIIGIRQELHVDTLNNSQENKNPIQNEFYFSIPYSDGSFLNEHKTLDKKHNSFYKIIKESENSAELFFIPGELDRTALNDINGYLAPVCTIENIENRLSATKILLLKSGKVVLSDGRWKIDNNDKVKIQLI
jgi:hypothetical protein